MNIRWGGRPLFMLNVCAKKPNGNAPMPNDIWKLPSLNPKLGKFWKVVRLQYSSKIALHTNSGASHEKRRFTAHHVYEHCPSTNKLRLECVLNSYTTSNYDRKTHGIRYTPNYFQVLFFDPVVEVVPFLWNKTYNKTSAKRRQVQITEVGLNHAETNLSSLLNFVKQYMYMLWVWLGSWATWKFNRP